MSSVPAPLAIQSHALCLVPLFSAALPGYDAARRASLVRLVLQLRDADGGVTASNRYGWHSGRSLHLRQEPDIAWLLQQLGAFVRGSLDAVGPDLRRASAAITSCWANVGGRQAWNEPHSHLPAHWSGVFYVAVDDALQGVAADDKAGCIEFVNPVPHGRPVGAPGSHWVRPHDGLALLFPAHVLHYVHPNVSDATRISIAFNLDLAFGEG